ncbi:MAG: Smr/MutS family protein [Archangium sp.]|nr:Smr/MutS family protein [Archangium sp.]MDP3155113.1 Smr/MutS family protein [Archangium sp.]MDP3574148.1 Smr/MutS family protein [Archangium sp.]
MEVSDRTLASLGFDDIRAALAGRCRTEVGQERARARGFLQTRDEVQASLTLSEEARALKAEPITLPITGIVDVRTSIDRASKSGMLEPRELINICQVLFSFERSHELLVDRRDRLPGLAALGHRLPVLTKLATRLDRSFEASGEISDRASTDLRDARETARGLHRRIRGRLDELLRDEKFNETLREGYYSVRNDRYVVPVKSSHQRDVTGIVHNASQSGQTLFVEPAEMIGMGNELAIAQSIVLEEERKVLLELSGLVGREAGKLVDGVDALSSLDELEAIASLSNDLKAAAPHLEPADGVLALKGLRHPRLMLKGGEIISNDVELGDARSLVVSGPNAGGKTVTLTGVGLCALMTRAGLPIPCDPGSRIPLFNQVHSAIGDQQDLQAGLSTFSAHVTMLRDITTVAKRGALVLIDEIAADTDPREGAAIATAVLEDLLTRGAIVLVTTHLEELKALAHLDPRFVNARVGFDGKRMSPTYRLQIGFAGASSAIDIARRVGLSESICVRAHDLAINTGGALSKALAAAEEERRKLYEQRDVAERDAREAKLAREQAEAELSAASKKRKEEEVKFREALRAELEFARNQIRAIVEKLETEKGEKALKSAQAVGAELTARINEQTSAERGARQELKGDARELAPLELKVGARARHRSMDAEVEIIELNGETATVAAGALKMRVPVSELGPATKAKEVAKFPGANKKEARLEKVKEVAAQVLTLASPTIDVRGERTEDAMRKIDQFLDRCTRNGDEAAIIIHGHGTGAIKRDLRDSLKRSPYAKSFRPGDASEGGDGVTVVIF